MKGRKIRKKNMVKWVSGVIIITIALLLGVLQKEDLYARFGAENKIATSHSILEEDLNTTENIVCLVERVVDGDTFEIRYQNKKEKVRLIGIDTPESVHPDASKNSDYGKKASDYMKELIEGKRVTLEWDTQVRDKYGRLLAYVYLENGEMVNSLLLKQGYAQIATYPPNVKYVEMFTQLQKEARQNEKGFWKENILKK